MKLAFAAGGATDVDLVSKPYSLEQLAARLSKPRVGKKDGSYYIRGGELAEAKRADANLKSAELIILDGDSRVDPSTGEVLPGAPPLDEVCAVLDGLDLTYIAHTSHSYKPGELWKYRIVLPARMGDQESLDAAVDWLIDQINSAGCWLADVTENRKWAQPWFLPRVSNEADLGQFVFRQRLAGVPFPTARALKHAAEKRKAAEAEERARAKPIAYPKLGPERTSVIDDFNRDHGLDWVRAALEAKGYRFAYFDKRHNSYRFLRPGSETGIAGVVVFQGERGDWCCWSHHGGADPLSGRLTDPFSLYAIFEHNGSLSNAARWLVQQRDAEIVARAKNRVVQSEEQIPAPEHQNTEDRAVDPISGPSSAILAPEAPAPRISVRMAAELERVKVKWLVEGLVPSGSFIGLYGKPGSYKSFCALYIAGMIAAGREAFGRSVEQGDVIYVAGEGAAGLKARWDALAAHYALPVDVPVGFVAAQLDLRSNVEDMEALVMAIRSRSLAPKMIVIDTLARAFAGGDENSAQDMGAFIAVTAAIQANFGGCALMIVHHSGKNEEAGMRGSSALLGAVDTELSVRKLLDAGDQRVGALKVTKQKDGEDGIEMQYRMNVVRDALDPNESSLALEPVAEGDEVAVGKGRRISPDEQMALEALDHAILAAGYTSSSPNIPRHAIVVGEQHWRAEFYSRRPDDGHADEKKASDAKRKAFGRVRKRLLEGGVVGHRDGAYWRIAAADGGPDEF